MKVYTVRILDTVFADIGDIADYIVAVSTPEHAAVAADIPVVVRCVRCVGFAIMSGRKILD